MYIATNIPLLDSTLALIQKEQVDLGQIDQDLSWSEASTKAEGLLLSAGSELPDMVYEAHGQLAAIGLLNRDERLLDVPRATGAGILVLEPLRGESASQADFILMKILTEARTGKYDPVELAGKRLGILGFGPTAKEVARRAKAFGLQVVLSSEECNRVQADLYEADLLPTIDLLVSVDILVNLQTRAAVGEGRFGKDEIQLLRKEAIFIHLGDPQVLRMNEVVRALDWGYLNRFIIDLPPGYEEIQTVLSRYIGEACTIAAAGNTLEARRSIEREMARDLIQALRGQAVESAMNIPRLRLAERRVHAPWLRLATLLGQMLGARLDRPPKQVTLYGGSEAPDLNEEALWAAFLEGLAHGLGEARVNRVSARHWADEAGIDRHWQAASQRPDGLSAAAGTIRGSLEVGGSIRHQTIQLTRLDQFRFTAEPTAHLLLVPHANRPGMVGQVGTLLGARQVNIRGMVLGQKEEARDIALMWIMLDKAPNEDLLAEITALNGMIRPEYIFLPNELLTPID
ncbi:NAD(P)-dependent oxidoreductase [Peptococcus simiae]|uniref:NAD(P)-dependent oxidoreductase n=1 Tax=Peptococcus simiae TaxID=1643805 RepID=UPI0039815DCF